MTKRESTNQDKGGGKDQGDRVGGQVEGKNNQGEEWPGEGDKQDRKGRESRKGPRGGFSFVQ